MKEQLVQYVELLFAGAKNCEDIKQEILQNTLDRYDDLIAEGRSPEAAYRLAIIGIGDMGEILNASAPSAGGAQVTAPSAPEEADTPLKKRMRAIAVGLYILCPIPLIVLDSFGMDILGLCGTLFLVAAATVILMIFSKKEPAEEVFPLSPGKKRRTQLQKSIEGVIWALGLTLYFVVSFTTGAWYITWIIFPLTGAVEGLIKAILDLMEVSKHEN